MLSERTSTKTATPASPCLRLADQLPGVVDGTASLGRNDRRHVERCLRCQAELAQYRKLLKAMQALRSATAATPTGLVTDVLSAIEAAGERRAVRAALGGRRVAYLGGIAATAAAAGAGAAIVLVSRGRKGRFPLAG